MRSHHFNFIQLIERSLNVKPPLENPKNFNRFLISLMVLEKWAILCWKLLRMRTPHSNFIQPMAEVLKYKPLYKTQNFQAFFDITNGSRNVGNFM